VQVLSSEFWPKDLLGPVEEAATAVALHPKLQQLADAFTEQVAPHAHTRHTSHVTRHTSHVTRHTSHFTRHTPSTVQDSQATPQLEVETRSKRTEHHVHHGGWQGRAAARAAVARDHAAAASGLARRHSLPMMMMVDDGR
jgi:hypothetical protein